MNKQQEFENAIQKNHIELVKILLNDKNVDPSDNYNFAIQYSSLNGLTDIVKLLLKDNRIDPSDKGNYAIYYSDSNGYIDIRELLWSNQRVKNTLKNNCPKLYNRLITQEIKIKLINFSLELQR